MRGFTLAELLIALAILGVIATFTIPKVLQAQQDSTYKSMGKEAAAAFSGAFQAYTLDNAVASTTGPKDLTPFLNYVKINTAATVDQEPNSGTADCSSASITCLQMHTGGILFYCTDRRFNGTSATNFIQVLLDPDGEVSNAKALGLFLYTNGRLVTWTGITAGSSSYACGAVRNIAGPDATKDPSWFNWD